MTVYKSSTLYVDIQNDNVEYGDIGVKYYTNDINTTQLNIRILRDGTFINFNKEKYKPYINLFMGDGTIFLDQPVEISDAENGLLMYKLSDKVKHAGWIKFKLILKKGNESLHVSNFKLEIKDTGILSEVRNIIDVDTLASLFEMYVQENPTRYKGDKGDKGDKGEQGIKGDKGDKGDNASPESVAELLKPEVKTQVNNEFVKLSAENQGSAEVVQARSTFTTLNERLSYKENLDAELKRVSGANAKKPLNIPTYFPTDNHAVHPRVFRDTSKKFGYEWIMAFTPYSFGGDRYENPSIVVSDDGINWYVPTGLTNPIVSTTLAGVIHLSDVDLFSNGTELELWYRESHKTNKQSRILRMKSTNTVNWSNPEVIFDYGGGYGYGASSVVYKDGVYELYYNRFMSLSREGYCVRKGTPGNWSEEVPVNFEFSEMFKGHVSWHIEVNYLDGKYICLNHAAPGQFEGGKLFYFDSTDGVNFKNCKLLIAPSDNGFDSAYLYKSSLIKKDNEYWIYYSGFTKRAENHIGLAIGTNFDNLTGFDAEKNNIVYATEIRNDSSSATKVNAQLNLQKRTQLTNTTDNTTAYVSVGKNGFIKAYRYSSGEHMGGFETSGILFNNTTTRPEVIRNDKMLLYNNSTQRLIVRDNGAEADVPKMVKFKLTPNTGNGTVVYQTPNSYISSVVADTYGMLINTINIPAGVSPTVIFNFLGSTPPQNTAEKYMTYYYIRENSANRILIGFKENPTSSSHMNLSGISAGAFEVTLLF